MDKFAIEKYATLVFDCDGVILDANRLKTDAFRSATLSYGRHAADAMVRYHIERGGISRYRKFEYFLSRIVGRTLNNKDLNALLETYAYEVWIGLLRCKVADGLEKLRALTPDSRWLVVSGGDQSELREIFTKRSIDHFFDGGIFGSPDSKDEILGRELKNGGITRPSVFFGDSRYDFEAATKVGLDFVFVSEWSEFHDWKKYFEKKNIFRVNRLEDLVAPKC